MKNRNLLILLFGQLISQIGDKFYMLALSFWVLDITKSPAYMGIALFCSFFPAAVLGFFSGVIVDRYNRKNIIVFTDLLRGIIVSVVVVLYYQKLLTVPVVLGVQVLLSINTAFFDPAIPSIIPQIVAENQLTRANSMTQLIRGISSVLGPVLGGICVGFFGYAFVFIFNALSYLISGIFEMFIRLPSHQEFGHQKSNFLNQFKEGMQFVSSSVPLMILLLIIALLHFFIGSIEAFFPIIAKEMGGNGPQNLGYLQTSLGIGIIISSAVIGWINFQKNESLTLFLAIFVIGLIYILIACHFKWYSSYTFNIFLLFALFGGVIILAATCFRSIIQKSIPNSIAGRVFGVVGSVSDISIPLAMLVYGFLLTYFPSQMLLLYTGIIIAIATPILFMVYKRVERCDKKQ
jgi:MFS transporter, DHA3 family, macrolide efflux protein